MDEDNTYTMLRRAAAETDRSHLARIVLGGADRRTLLNGLLTNDIAALAPGSGCYAAWLTPQGRMITDMVVLELGDRLVLLVPAALGGAVIAHIEESVFSEDVTMEDEAGLYEHLGVDGPRAADTIHHVLAGGPAVSGTLYGSSASTFQGATVIAARTDWLGIPGYDLFVEVRAAGPLRDALAGAGARSVDPATADVVRVESGRPRFGRDMDEHTIPLEAGIEDRAISFTKGCYVGQEVIIRVLHRGGGRVARRLVGLTLERDAPPGTPVLADTREMGRLTSVVQSPALGHVIALGYVGRDFTEPGTRVDLDGGGSAVVTKLPFVQPS
ncbi:MAG TPA: glycine cleavage T C-terminal barrel domain-containing protein [Vicinamibacterales bacterium]|nr:glycine cleavage T C-terminal barrel domain-containing protein [Vicinamibacterales bacterium]